MKNRIKSIEHWVFRQDKRLHAKLDGLSSKERLIVVLVMFAIFALCALLTLGTALYRIGRKDQRQIRIEHIKQIDLHTKQDSINPYKQYNNGTK